MEIKATLQKPFEENERMNFIVEYNHNQSYVIEETETELLEKIKETQTELIVLGLPKNMDGSLGDSAKKSIMFKH